MIKPVEQRIRELKIAIDENVVRRNLSDAEFGSAIKQLDALNRELYGENKGGQRTDLVPTLNEVEGWSLQKTAELVNLPKTTVHRAIKIATAIEEYPELASKTSGQEILSNYKQRQGLKTNTELVAMVKPPVFPSLFKTILIDPPWDWGDEGDANQFGRARPEYATLPLEEILKLPVSELSESNAHIYLWITNRSLPKGFQLLDTWEFRYITALTWCKPSFGMGNYFRGQTEHILFGVKGSCPLLRHDVGTMFMADRGEMHSSKPEKVYEIIESCSPSPWLEMFARKKRDGWYSWGANAPV